MKLGFYSKCIFQFEWMQKSTLTAVLFLFTQIIFGQISLTPNYLNTPSAFNPASLGIIQKEGINVGFFSQENPQEQNIINGELEFNELIGKTFNRFYVNDSNISRSFRSKRIYFLGYHKTIEIEKKIGLTIGVQTQLRQDGSINLTSPQTIGFTANSHFKLNPKKGKNRYFSTGIQFHLHYFNTNKAVVEYLYNELLNTALFYSLDEYNDDISNLGYSLSYNINFQSFRKEKKAFVFGLSASTTKEKIVDPSISNTSDGLAYKLTRYFAVKSFISFQKVIKKNLFVEAYGTSGPYLSAFIGLGFRVNQRAILRIYVGGFDDYFNYFESLNLNLILETKNFKFATMYGNKAIAGAYQLDLSCYYNLQPKKSLRLLRLN